MCMRFLFTSDVRGSKMCALLLPVHVTLHTGFFFYFDIRYGRQRRRAKETTKIGVSLKTCVYITRNVQLKSFGHVRCIFNARTAI